MSVNFHPISEKIKKSLLDEIFMKSLKNLHVSLFTFRGAGKPYELQYILEKEKEFFKPDRVFVWIDLRYIFNQAFLSQACHVYTFSSEIKLPGKFDAWEQYLAFFHDEYVAKGYNITFVFQGMRLCYSLGYDPVPYVSVISTLLRLNPDKCSGIFLVDKELDNKTKNTLLDIYQSMLHDIVWGGTVLFDIESAKYLFDQNSSIVTEVRFTEEFKTALTEMCIGDPNATKHFIMKVYAEPTLQEKFVAGDSSARFDLFDSVWLNTRFEDILDNLTFASKHFLLTQEGTPSEFLLKTGLVSEMPIAHGYKVMSKLFELWLNHNKSRLLAPVEQTITQITSNDNKAIGTKINDALTAQELLVFEYLQKHYSELVTKDSLAQVIWGNDWEENYSDWALDKLTSNLRKKLKETNAPFNLKSSKGKGVVLI